MRSLANDDDSTIIVSFGEDQPNLGQSYICCFPFANAIIDDILFGVYLEYLWPSQSINSERALKVNASSHVCSTRQQNQGSSRSRNELHTLLKIMPPYLLPFSTIFYLL